MNYGSVLGITFSIIGFLLSWQGLWLLCRALWPRRVRRAAERCARSRVASFFIGLPIAAVTVAIAIAAGRRGGTPGQLAGWALGFLFLMYAGTGMSGFVTFIGERLSSPADAVRPWWATVRGGAALEFACLFPVIGWFVLLPCAIVLGTGALTLSFFAAPAPPDDDLHSALARNRDAAGLRDLPRLDPVEAGA